MLKKGEYPELKRPFPFPFCLLVDIVWCLALMDFCVDCDGICRWRERSLRDWIGGKDLGNWKLTRVAIYQGNGFFTGEFPVWMMLEGTAC